MYVPPKPQTPKPPTAKPKKKKSLKRIQTPTGVQSVPKRKLTSSSEESSEDKSAESVLYYENQGNQQSDWKDENIYHHKRGGLNKSEKPLDTDDNLPGI